MHFFFFSSSYIDEKIICNFSVNLASVNYQTEKQKNISHKTEIIESSYPMCAGRTFVWSFYHHAYLVWSFHQYLFHKSTFCVFFFFFLNPSGTVILGPSLKINEWQKKAARDVMGTCTTHVGVVYDVSHIEHQKQNDSALGCALETFKRRILR